MKTQLAWKVVAVSAIGTYLSAIWSNFVVYSNKNWSVPHEGDNPFLFVFNTRANARGYTKGMIADRIKAGQKFRVCRCKVRNLTEDRTVRRRGQEAYRMKLYNLPEGTMFADAVKLV